MRGWQEGRLRCLIHFLDGGAGMRYRDERLAVGDELTEGAPLQDRARGGAFEPAGARACLGNVDRGVMAIVEVGIALQVVVGHHAIVPRLATAAPPSGRALLVRWNVDDLVGEAERSGALPPEADLDPLDVLLGHECEAIARVYLALGRVAGDEQRPGEAEVARRPNLLRRPSRAG
jgi:hypothetical protein